MSGQWQPEDGTAYDPLQRILARADRSRMHLHRCAKCDREVICLTVPCVFRASKLETEWLCTVCKPMRDLMQLAGPEAFEVR